MILGNGVAGYKEFAQSRHHEIILNPGAVSNTSKSSKLGISKLSSSSSTSINNVLKKAVVATKSWAGDGSAYKYSVPLNNRSKVASTRSFSSGLCSLMNEGHAVYNGEDHGSPRPFVFDPKPVFNNYAPSNGRRGVGTSLSLSKGNDLNCDSYASNCVGSSGVYGNIPLSSSGAVSLDAAQSTDPRSRDSKQRSLQDSGRQSLTNVQSSSQQALCDHCFVSNLHKEHQEYQHQLLKLKQMQQRSKCCTGGVGVGGQHYSTFSPTCVSMNCCNGHVSRVSVPSADHFSVTSTSGIRVSNNHTSWHEQHSRCNSMSSTGPICRCSSDIRLPDPRHHTTSAHSLHRRHETSLHSLSSERPCNACYSSPGYEDNGGAGFGCGCSSYGSLQASSNSCIHKYDDYVDYTESPYASHSPYQNTSPYAGGHSPYTSHYDTPPLSSHSPPVASSPSHSYYSPSDSYTTPTENSQSGGGSINATNSSSVFAALHSLSNHGTNMVASAEASLNSGGGATTHPHHSSSLVNGGHHHINVDGGPGLCSRGGSVPCVCSGRAQYGAASGGCSGDSLCGQDTCVDPCKEACGSGITCCTLLGTSSTQRAGSLKNKTDYGGKQLQESAGGGGRYKHYISGYHPNPQQPATLSSRSKQQESHPNWKSSESSYKEELPNGASRVSSSRSEGLLCTEL